MKLTKHLILSLLILALNSTYAQYPILRKIGNDSFVIITVKQGDQINRAFEDKEKAIKKLKDSVYVMGQREVVLKEMSLRRIHVEDSLKLAADTNSVKYRVSKEYYDDSKNEYRKYLRNTSIYATILTIFIMVVAGIFGK